MTLPEETKPHGMTPLRFVIVMCIVYNLIGWGFFFAYQVCQMLHLSI